MSATARRRARARRALAALLVVTIGGPTVAHATEAPSSPDESPEPSPQELAASIKIWDPEGSIKFWDPDGSVKTWDLDGSVDPVEVETTDGDNTVLSLDSDILFAFGEAALTETAATRMGELVADVPQGAAVQVTGHTDSIGDDASNVTLSQERAQAVASAVTAARSDLVLDVQGRGEAEPVAPNTSGADDNPEGREQNRRVEIRYTG